MGLVCLVGCADAPAPQPETQATRADIGMLDRGILDAFVLVDAAPVDMAVDAAPDLMIDAMPMPGDRDGDRVPDDEDAFPDNPTEWADRDGDGTGDNSDPFPNDPEEWVDNDNDGIGDNADLDDDNDGISDEEELVFGADCVIGNPLRADSDGDGINDDRDPYPRDPFAEFMVRPSEDGRIDLFLSNRDGTFQPAVTIGMPLMFEDRPLTYGGFSVGDFDGNGQMDFLAHTSQLIEGQPTRDLYLFVRDDKADEFVQRRIGETDVVIAGVVADLNRDFGFDVARFDFQGNGFRESGQMSVFLNNNNPSAQCVVGETAQEGCFFVRLPAQDVTAAVAGQWSARSALQAVNLNPDQDEHVDLVLSTYANGGNALTTVYSLSGNGDGTFAAPVERFRHNENRAQAPANSVMFADFNADGVGDVCLGFDDDGQAGGAWTYFGVGNGSFFDQPVLALDLNPNNAREGNGGRELLGRTYSGRTFDFDFDGFPDIVVGVNHVAYATDGQTRVYRGRGDGTFDPEFTQVGPDSRQAHGFAIPQPRCPDFNLVRD
jgi:hypothetical protein